MSERVFTPTILLASCSHFFIIKYHGKPYCDKETGSCTECRYRLIHAFPKDIKAMEMLAASARVQTSFTNSIFMMITELPPNMPDLQ